jgi:hypothetical protein
MLKGYVSGRVPPEDRKLYDIEYFFTSNPQAAWPWRSREEAESDCRLISSQEIEIPSALVGMHVCKDFKVEELGADKFVIYCEASFITQPQTKP